MSDPTSSIPSFPQYPPAPRGIPLLTNPKQQGILNKVISRMMSRPKKPTVRGRTKGLVSQQSVAIKHKKVKWY